MESITGFYSHTDAGIHYFKSETGKEFGIWGKPGLSPRIKKIPPKAYCQISYKGYGLFQVIFQEKYGCVPVELPMINHIITSQERKNIVDKILNNTVNNA